MLGMTAHTIRAWERRFAAVSPMRTHSGQRRYRLEDVETLKRVKDLASSRGLSLRIAVAEALGELPELEGLGPQSSTAGEEATRADGGPWRVVADLEAQGLLVKVEPLPERRVLGNLRDRRVLLAALGLNEASRE